MLLPRCFDNLKVTHLLPLVAVLVLSACASPGPKSAAGRQADTVSHGDVPAQALTLFEQAAAAMAAGDFLDAELRFREFLRRYPDYPGAYVNLAIIYTNNGDDANNLTHSTIVF